MDSQLKFDALPQGTNRKPVVVIVGAGIAGLTLAALLEKQGVEYSILERAKEVKPLGASMSMGPAVTPLFKQMGFFDEFSRVGKTCNAVHLYNEKREYDHTMDFNIGVEMSGCDNFIISRPVLVKLLQSRVPSHRIHLNKKVVSTVQTKDGVRIQTSDNQIHEADILIGADGTYSTVRQGLYDVLKAEGKLLPSDDTPLPFSCVCLVGQTTPLDPAQYPHLALDHSQFLSIRGEGSPYSWATWTTKQNTICWTVFRYLDKESTKTDESFRNSEWGPEAAEAMCNEVRHLAIPGAPEGVTPFTLGDMIDLTPPNLTSKVMLEEKVFDTWYNGRIALLGDACHKINPAGGQGAMLAIHDAVCIANWISVLPSTKIEDVESIFKKYKEERFPLAKDAYARSQMFRNTAGKNMVSKITQFFMKRVPAWLWRIIVTGNIKDRPQVSFLPLVSDMGTVKPAYQASLHETLKIHQEKATASV